MTGDYSHNPQLGTLMALLQNYHVDGCIERLWRHNVANSIRCWFATRNLEWHMRRA